MNKSKPLSVATRLLDPVERTSGVLFGLIMALTLGCTWKHMDFSFYLFNPGGDDPTLVFTVGREF